MKSRKKGFFTLLEVLISMGLAVVMISALLFFYRYLSEMNLQINKTEAENFAARFVQSRLAGVFYQLQGLKLKPVVKKGQEEPVAFYSLEEEGGLQRENMQTLIFIFDNGASMNTPFANEVLAKLFVDENNRLCLALWPHPKRWPPVGRPPMNIEVLMENVSHLSLKFYVPPQGISLQKEEENKFPELKPDEWIASWKREYNQIPALIRVDLTLKTPENTSKPLSFSFPLIDRTKVIEYTVR